MFHFQIKIILLEIKIDKSFIFFNINYLKIRNSYDLDKKLSKNQTYKIISDVLKVTFAK